MPELEHFDLVVIGAGPAGEKAAAQTAYFKKRVAIVECEPEPGGAAVHTGTLPSKTLRETALYLSGYHARELYGVALEVDRNATLQRLMSRKNAISAAESRSFRKNLALHDVQYVQGHGRIVDAHTVSVTSSTGERRLSADFILIATGSKPHRPTDIDFADDWIHDSDEILTINDMPTSLTILGGGVIGCEYACMFAALGVGVTLVDARPEILPFLDAEIVARLKAAMSKLGIVMVQGQRWTTVLRSNNGVVTTLTDGRTLENQQLLFAAGRTGRVTDLGLETVGLAADSRGYIPVDREFRTKVPSIFAAGDVIGFPALASVSMEQGRVAMCHAFGFGYKQAVAAEMPYGIYTIPEVSSYGETEETCRQKGIDYVVGRGLFENNARGKITGDLEGITKLLVDAKSRKLIGVHVIGERATELVHIGQTAIHLGATVDLFIDMVFNYPTLADSYKYAAYHCLAALMAKQ
ncbi:MAG TPA: Si-specific NAD(P)(+) transhydrogenase [Polyangiaceae bacterium]|nr:Si-specific NAD(P)(+) transhydrogenase [Polyangiaceae bacterium]